MQDNFNELQSGDYKKLNLTKGAGVISSDPLKQARAVRENAAKQGRDIKIYQNELGEYGLEENGVSLGLINKKGLSTQDFKNLGKEVVLDPTNLLMFTPFGAAAKGASLAAKLGSKAKRAATLAPAIAGGEVARSGVANKAGGQDFIVDGDLSNAALSGALGVGSIEALEGLAKGYKETKQSLANTLKRTEQDPNALRFTKGEQTGDKKALQLEQMARDGLLGEDNRNLIASFDQGRKQVLTNQIEKDLLKGKELDNVLAPKQIAEDVIQSAKSAKANAFLEQEALHKAVDPTKTAISQSNMDMLLDNLESSLPKVAIESIKKRKDKSPYWDIFQTLKDYREYYKNPNKGTLNPPKDIDQMFKNQGGDVNVNLSDGSTANFRYGDYDPVKGKGFAGKKIEMKHPNVATKDLQDKIETAKLVHTYPNGRKVFLTREGELVVSTEDGNILTAYKPDEGSPASSSWVPDAYDVASQQQTPRKSFLPQQSDEVNLNKAFALPSKQQVYKEIAENNGYSSVKELTDNVPKQDLERAYNTYRLDILNQDLQELSQAYAKESAKAAPDKTKLGSLAAVLGAYNDTLTNLAQKGVLEGNSEEFTKLLAAKKATQDYHKKFTNFTEDRALNLGDDRVVKSGTTQDTGARRIVDLMSKESLPSEMLIDLLTQEKNDSVKIQAIRKLKDIFGENSQELEQVKELYLRNMFGSFNRKKAADEALNIKQASQNISNKIIKKDAVAKELFDEKELENLEKIGKDLKKLVPSVEPLNTSGTGPFLIRESLMRMPGLSTLYDKVAKNLYNSYQLRKNLNYNQATDKLLREPVNLSNKEQATIRSLANILANTKEVE